MSLNANSGGGNPPPAGNGNGGGNGGGFWGFLSDLIGAGANVLTNIYGKATGQPAVIYQPQTAGISPQLLTIIAVALLVLIAWKIWKGSRR